MIRQRLHKHGISFKHAFEGIIWSLKTQPNYQIHLLLSFLSMVGAYMYRVSQTELIILIFLIFVGLTIETVNTSIERAADAIDTAIRDDLKQTKDVAAGAMLFFAIGAFIIACIIFLPKIFA